MEDIYLDNVGVKITKTKLGATVAILKKDDGKRFTSPLLFLSDWSVSQLRAIADYMEENPNCTLFSDGSGKKEKYKNFK
jgi:hypothetical protein